MKVDLEFGQAEQAPVAASLPQATVFQVPDDTESEDSEDMNDIDSHSQAAFSSVADQEDLQASASTLTENGLELSEFHGFDTSDPIDLTSEPDLISDGNNPSSSSPLSDGYHPTTQDAGHDADDDADYTLRTVEPEDVDLGAQDCPSIALLSDGFAPAQQFKEGLSVDIAAGNTVPGMDGPLSEDQHLSPRSEITPLLRVQSLGESSGKLDYFTAREQNKQYIQNAIVSRDAQVELTPPPQQEAPRSLKDTEGLLKEARGSSSTDELHEASASKTDELEEVASIKSFSKKRKADQIESSPLKVYVDDGVSNTSPAASSADQYALPRDVLPNGDGSYAYKRVKTAAEYVGLMAIGGAAVMTALIATAPNF
ncbi:FHA domain protein [Beauveria brongniartii RCEF 3172]|uniref:FHA domain protein n=1 Tax=Beauveria brongniartii RCEF 3172 TaxID=1081107 RepID=A0A167J450_9HYPO|nr:FHA domain protein [Beauveria brongniartii RCEF 3172]